MFCLILQLIAKSRSRNACLRDGCAVDSCTCCHTETEVTDQTCYFTQSQNSGAGPISRSTDLTTLGARQGSHYLWERVARQILRRKWGWIGHPLRKPVARQILRRKWGWIGHPLRKPASNTTRQALTWNPQGKRKRGRPRNSWRRDTEAELKQQGTGLSGGDQEPVSWRPTTVR